MLGQDAEVVLETCAGRPDRLWSALTYALARTFGRLEPATEDQSVRPRASDDSLQVLLGPLSLPSQSATISIFLSSDYKKLIESSFSVSSHHHCRKVENLKIIQFSNKNLHTSTRRHPQLDRHLFWPRLAWIELAKLGFWCQSCRESTFPPA